MSKAFRGYIPLKCANRGRHVVGPAAEAATAAGCQ